MLTVSEKNSEMLSECVKILKKFFEKIFSLIAEALKNLKPFFESEKVQAFLHSKRTHYFRYMAWLKSKERDKNVDYH